MTGQVIEQLFPKEQLDDFESGREEEYFQPLMDLGYLRYDKFAALGSPDDGVMASALAQFRIDLERAGLRGNDLSEGIKSDSRPGTLELQMLFKLTALDGEVELRSRPEIGDQDLFSRVLVYRLVMLGQLREEFLGEAWNQTFNYALDRIRNWFSINSEALLLRLTGNLSDLCEEVLANPRFKNRSSEVVYLHFPKISLPPISRIPRRFVKQLEEDIGEKVSIFKERVQKQTDFVFVKKANRSQLNRFMIRLLQLKQWVGGMYIGRIDGQPGRMTFQSLEELSEVSDLPFKNMIAPLGKSYWALNIRFALQKMHGKGKEFMQNKGLKQITEKLSEEVNGLKSLAVPRLGKVMQKEFVKVQEAAKKNLPKGRRVYLGSRSILHSIGQKINSIVSLITKGFRKLKNLVGNFIRMVFREIREGMRTFVHGLEFLFGKRSFRTSDSKSGQEIFTDFDVDFDVIGVCPPHIPNSSVDEHLQVIESRVDGLGLSMRLTGRILGWGLSALTGPFGWVRFCMKLASLFRELMDEQMEKRASEKESLHPDRGLIIAG